MISIRCLVDNSVLNGTALWGEHGLAFLIETPDGLLLFDTGQSGTVLLHNAEQMNIDLGRISALALSHAHNDHTGGLDGFLEGCRPGVALVASPDLFRERFSRHGEKQRSIGMRVSRERIAQRLDLRLSAAPTEVLSGIWTTGEIDLRPEFEGRSTRHGIMVGDQWQPDPYRDDMSLVIESPGGLIVICGCCHAGLLNTLAHIKRCFEGDILAIFGGTHLESASSEVLAIVPDRLRALSTYGAPTLYLNHCTGIKALLALSQALGDCVHPCPVGTAVSF